MTIQTVILAAGQGKRMHSDLPKVLHGLAGKPLIQHVIETAAKISSTQPIVIYGHEGEQLQEALADFSLRWVAQKQQLGTGHALLQALPKLSDNDNVLVLYGDVPLVSEQTLRKLIESTPKKAIGMLTAMVENPSGYGRIKRNAKKKITHIIEEKEASAKDRAIKEINSGIYFLPVKLLKKWLPKLKNKNAQGEYYLTDIIAHAVKEKITVHAVQPDMAEEVLGVNDCVQLAKQERFYQLQIANQLMLQGVMIIDPARIDVRGEVQIGRNVTLDVNVILEGHVEIGRDCYIGPNTYLCDVIIGDGVVIVSNSEIVGASIGNECRIGPFARIRPDTEIAEQAHVGNFVEVKKSKIGFGSKMNHLAYIGDSDIGNHVNIGAGTITCNYDGVNKHKTIIGDNAFIGSNTSLVAPVVVGIGATIGAGSTITKNAPSNRLTLARGTQIVVESWERPTKNEKFSQES